MDGFLYELEHGNGEIGRFRKNFSSRGKVSSSFYKDESSKRVVIRGLCKFISGSIKLKK